MKKSVSKVVKIYYEERNVSDNATIIVDKKRMCSEEHIQQMALLQFFISCMQTHHVHKCRDLLLLYEPQREVRRSSL